MATTARPRRPASAAADTPAPSAKTAAKKKAAAPATPAQPTSSRAAAPQKKAAAPVAKTAPAAKKAPAQALPAKKKPAAKAPVQQELVLEQPGLSAAAKKAAAKKVAGKRAAATPVAAPAPAPASVATPTAKRPAAKRATTPAQASLALAAAPVAPATDKPAKKAAAKTPARKAPAGKAPARESAAKPAAPTEASASPAPKQKAKPAAKPTAPPPTTPVATQAPSKTAGKTTAKKAPAKKTAAARDKTPSGRRGSATAAPSPSTAEEVIAPAPDLLSALAQQADEAPATEPESTVAAQQPAPEVASDAEPVDASADIAPAPGADTAEAAEAAEAPAPATVKPASNAPLHSSVQVVEHNHQRHLQWQAGQHCPPAVAEAARARVDDSGHLNPSDDAALPTLLRLAADARHRVDVDAAVWQQLAADRDARHRLHRLEAAYPEGPSSPALQGLLQTTLPAYQAEGALFAVVAGRALIADERGLGKRVQAIAAASLWRKHFGVQRVLVLCTPSQRAAWQHAWTRLAGGTLSVPPQVIEGPLHQRQAMWSAAAEVRIVAPEALDSDAAHIADWAPELLIVDEPQQLSGWQALQAPLALVLCGAPLAGPPALLQAIVEWLDVHRQGALQAVLRIQQARAENLSLPNEELERLDNSLSRLMLQRLRSEVQDQLPPSVHSERLVPLAPAQRDAHERLRMQVQRLLAGWQRCGYLSDADQWQLSAALRALPEACHRSQPGDAGSGLAEASIAALQAQLDDWSATGTERVAVVCATAADQAQLSERLRFAGTLQWLAAGETPAPETEVVLQVGVPWQAAGQAGGHANGHGTAPDAAGRQWVYLAAQGSLEQGLIDTLAWRRDTPCGPAEQAGSGFLHGRRLADWLQAWTHALQATPAA